MTTTWEQVIAAAVVVLCHCAEYPLPKTTGISNINISPNIDIDGEFRAGPKKTSAESKPLEILSVGSKKIERPLGIRGF